MEYKLAVDIIQSILEKDFYFNQITEDFKYELGGIFYVPQYNYCSNSLCNYTYKSEDVKKLVIKKDIKLALYCRFLNEKNNIKPLLAQVLLEVKEALGVSHYEPHCGNYLKVTGFRESSDQPGYQITFESRALPFEKSLCKVKSAHD